ncbi:hypothetical protein PPERSA_00346 [Pseudocohnilembus persalinus]|uniref:Gamma tubulin complex component protein N-terminal domain-containing protein n=1 Tax=Pseudocohnilembus persalinus TaxID=266149 RepID=A0A0V0QZ72_PSEPJ|nr:hypothetical protein PPERSA_00346 [Pseudocohnilembus persalinus]|eukprot:KRX07189.1 hypothetical protein PPERSA_00346 [Pseudocohnilembus persalinus]
MEEKHKNTSQLLEKLIQSITQLNQSDPATNKLLSYSLRILQSNIGGNRLDLDDQAIKNQLQKAAQKANPRQLDRIYDLVSQFERSRVVQQKNGILKLLIKLSNTKNISYDISLDTSIFQTKDPIIQKHVSQSQQIITHQQHQNQNQNYRSSSTTNLNVQHQQMSSIDNNTTTQSYNHPQTKCNNSTLTDICRKISDKGNEAIDLKENDLVCDLIFIFQGIDGHYIQFFSQEKAYQLKANVPVKESVREQINQLCEVGWLFKKVTDFLKLNPQGLINQSLHLAIKEELNEYYRLIAVLENLKNESIENSADPLTLRKLALWMRDPFERMKWLAIISDGCKNLIGCQVISQIFSYSGQGNMQINGLITRLLSALNQPLLKYLYNWVYLGELNDKQLQKIKKNYKNIEYTNYSIKIKLKIRLGEFFIIEHLNVDNNNLWNKKYSINYEQIPSVIEKKVVEKIFDIGKCEIGLSIIELIPSKASF